jgi:hypothetical protein
MVPPRPPARGPKYMRVRFPSTAVLLLALAGGARASSNSDACKPFDAAEVRSVLHVSLGPPQGTRGAQMMSCTARGGGLQVTLAFTSEPDQAQGSEGEFNQSVERARAAGQVQVQQFKETRCASILPSGGGKFGTFKAWCVLHSKKGRAVSLDVIAPGPKQLPSLEKVHLLAEAAAARIP